MSSRFSHVDLSRVAGSESHTFRDSRISRFRLSGFNNIGRGLHGPFVTALGEAMLQVFQDAVVVVKLAVEFRQRLSMAVWCWFSSSWIWNSRFC